MIQLLVAVFALAPALEPGSVEARALAERIEAANCATSRGGDCVSCHMPRVEAMRHMEFSNHWIGVYSDSNALVPAARP